jgi:hypothetical protein
MGPIELVAPFAVPFSAAVFLAGLTAYFVILGTRELTAIRVARSTAVFEQDFLREQITDLAERRRREQQKAERTWDGFRKFVVARKVSESHDICSFYFEPHDRRPLPMFMPGQYLTFRINIPGQSKPVIRCYSLSDGPKSEYFRCTIKRVGAPPGKPDGKPGLVSSHFHEQILEGDIVDVKAPSGQFFLDPAEDMPVVLIGGGIGLTPVLSMLNALVDAHSQRNIWFFYGLRHRGEHIMAEHLRQIAEDNPNVQLHICYSDPRPNEDKAGEHYDHAERVSADLLKKIVPVDTAHFYLCGPPPMMQSLVEGFHALGIPDARIHYEAFGPASVKKATASTQPAADATASSIEIGFSSSEKKIFWDGKSTLLEIAEANGIRIDSGCRAGNCGTCITAIKQGTVKYPSPPGTTVEAGSCLPCVAHPASNIVLDG